MLAEEYTNKKLYVVYHFFFREMYIAKISKNLFLISKWPLKNIYEKMFFFCPLKVNLQEWCIAGKKLTIDGPETEKTTCHVQILRRR